MSDVVNKNLGQFSHKTELPLKAEFFKKGQEILDKDRKGLCMLTSDIHFFHFFNRWYGKDAGDALLGDISRFLKLFDEQYGTLSAYMGGDNFSILFHFEQRLVNEIVSNILDIVRHHSPEESVISACFGAYEVTENTDENVDIADVFDYTVYAIDDAVKNAEIAVVWYDSDKIKQQEENLRKIPEIIEALRNNEFIFYLQPKCHLKTGKVIGSEALVRWKHPEKGIISPAFFVPIMEEHGLITRLDVVIWEQVCSQIRKWIDKGIRPLPISVNVSRVDIASVDVPEIFSRLIEKYDIHPSRIEIEITESAYADDDYLVLDTMNRLHGLGFKVLIDDFGSGYSSLNLLKDIQADVLKLDMKFLDVNYEDIDNTDKGMSIIESVLEMSRQLCVPAIIEGLETSEQLQYMQLLGCEFAQGYYFYKPMPVESFEKLITNPDIIGGKKDKILSKSRSHLQAFASYFRKAAIVNLDNGLYSFIKVDDLHREINSPEAENIHEYVNRFIEKGYIKKEDARKYLRLMDKDYIDANVKLGVRRFRHTLRTIIDGEYEWSIFEVLVMDDYCSEHPEVIFTWKEADLSAAYLMDVVNVIERNFHKMLKVDLCKKDFEIIHMYDDEKTEEQGFSSDISVWMKQYAEKGNVHEEDLQKYLEFMDVEKIRKHFEESDQEISVCYRRKVQGKFLPTVLEISKSIEYSEECPIVLINSQSLL